MLGKKAVETEVGLQLIEIIDYLADGVSASAVFQHSSARSKRAFATNDIG